MQLQEWYNKNTPDSSYVYANAATNQFIWVRDCFAFMIFNHIKNENISYKTFNANIIVESTHTSKSIKLPVYTFNFNGIKIKIRGNFHDWCFRYWGPIKKDFPSWIKKNFSYGYFEGMDNEDSSISFCVNTKEELYAVTWWLLNEGLS